MGDHQSPSADELGYHFQVCPGRSREARRDKKVYKDKEYPIDTGEPMEQSKPYATFAAALSRPPRVTWGDPPPPPLQAETLAEG